MKALTKEELMELGVTNVLEDGTVYVNGVIKEPKIYTKKHPYGEDKSYVMMSFVDRSVKNDIVQKYTRKDGSVRESKQWAYGVRSIQLGRLVLAWFYGKVPANMDADHIDNNPLNNRLDNLQMLTRKENLARRMLSWSEIYKLYHEKMDKEKVE